MTAKMCVTGCMLSIIVTAILQVLEQGRVGETYNVGGNSEKQNIEVVQTICDILDEKVAALARWSTCDVP